MRDRACLPRHNYVLTVGNLGVGHNPATRVRRFAHLFRAELERALRPLKDWEKVHELSFWFNDLGFLILYLIDVEGVSLSRRGQLNPMNYPMARETVMHGFKWSAHRGSSPRGNPFKDKAVVIRDDLVKDLDMRSEAVKPVHQDAIPPEYRVVLMPGHVDEQFILHRLLLPRLRHPPGT